MKVIAHRGWSAAYPENSLAAFAAALAVGADEIEFDVSHTADEVPVVLHDKTLLRTMGVDVTIDEITWQDLQALQPTVPGVLAPPALTQVLQLFGGRIGMNLHFKDADTTEETLARTLRLLSDHDWAQNNPSVYVAGRAPVLELALRHVPTVQRACLHRQDDPVALLEAALQFRCQRLQFFSSAVVVDDVNEAKAAGLTANLFHCEDPKEVPYWRDMGIDALLTDHADILVRAATGPGLATGTVNHQPVDR